MSTSGFVHFLVGMVVFLTQIAACFVFARRFAASGNRRWAVLSAVVGAYFLVTYVGLFALMGNRVASIAFALAIALALAWASALAAHLRSRN